MRRIFFMLLSAYIILMYGCSSDSNTTSGHSENIDGGNSIDSTGTGSSDIFISDNFFVIIKGSSRDVTAYTLPVELNDTLYYEIDDDNIVNITADDDTYKLYGVNVGETDVIFYSGNKSVSKKIHIRVEPVSVENIVINDSTVYLSEGSTHNINYDIVPEYADKDLLIWTSDNDNIATVKNGVITAVSEGQTIIKVSSESGYANSSVNVVIKKSFNVTFEPNIDTYDFTYGVNTKNIDIKNNGSNFDFIYEISGDSTFSASKTSSGIVIKTSENLSPRVKNAELHIYSQDKVLLKSIKFSQESNPNPTYRKIWTKGVNPHIPNMEEDALGFLQWNEMSGYGWYNVVKVEAKPIPTSPDSNMCWAMTSSNLLHWWFEQNKDLIEQYEEKTGYKCKYGYYLDKKNDDELNLSDIAKEFRNKFPNKGGYTDSGINWFIGTKYMPMVEGSPACFQQAFENVDRKIVERKILFKLSDFSKEIKNALESGKAIGLDFMLNGGGHAITLWGAEFDADDIMRNVYIVDSNYPYHVMVTRGVYEQDGLTYLRNLDYPDMHMNWRIVNIYTFDLARDILSDYLAK